MALAFRFPDRAVSEAELAQQCGCLEEAGTAANDAFNAACHYALPAVWLDNSRIEAEVEAALNAGCPVVANVQLRVLPYYSSGAYSPTMWHSVLIVGMDAQDVILHDPDSQQSGAQKRVQRTTFFSDWARRPYSAYRL
jgi:hypothetical protein